MPIIFPNPPASNASASAAQSFAQLTQFLLIPKTQIELNALGCQTTGNALVNLSRDTTSFFRGLSKVTAANAGPPSPGVIMTFTGAVGFSEIVQPQFGAFDINVIFGIHTLPDTDKAHFVGLSSIDSIVTLLAIIDPSAYPDVCGFAVDPLGTTWKFMRRTGAGATTIIDTTVLRLVNTVYRIRISMPASGASLRAQMWTIASFTSTALVFDTTFTTVLPATAVRLNLGMVGRSANGSGDGAISCVAAWGNLSAAFPIT